jgi:hypothetical protein
MRAGRIVATMTAADSASHVPPPQNSAFRHRGFLYYLQARFVVNFATQIMSVAVGWQVYDITRDPLDLGIVGLVQFLPRSFSSSSQEPPPTAITAAPSWACALASKPWCASGC